MDFLLYINKIYTWDIDSVKENYQILKETLTRYIGEILEPFCKSQ